MGVEKLYDGRRLEQSFHNKPVAIFSAATGPLGGARVQQRARRNSPAHTSRPFSGGFLGQALPERSNLLEALGDVSHDCDQVGDPAVRGLERNDREFHG